MTPAKPVTIWLIRAGHKDWSAFEKARSPDIHNSHKYIVKRAWNTTSPEVGDYVSGEEASEMCYRQDWNVNFS